MLQTWRWFGPDDPVTVRDMAQAGAQGVVSALHQYPSGVVWPLEAIKQRQAEIAQFEDGTPSGLSWQVVESLPVSEAIKQQKGDWRHHIENYRQSLTNLAEAGIEIICYNFMPILDWTRTDMAYRHPNGALSMRFDVVEFALFDLYILKRDKADGDYPADINEAALHKWQEWQGQGEEALARQTERLTKTIISGLPGSFERYDLAKFKEVLALYQHIDDQVLRRHHYEFLAEIIPHAEKLSLRLCCHPDDPPVPLLGLPRIMSTLEDYHQLVNAIKSPANGVTLCSGSLGARGDNDLGKMMQELAPHVCFVHLRNVTRESSDAFGSFYEDEHLDGDVDLVRLVTAILTEEQRRRHQGRADWRIPFRPDHGMEILDDHKRPTKPGYPAIGRLKGLAELRGLELGLKSALALG